MNMPSQLFIDFCRKHNLAYNIQHYLTLKDGRKLQTGYIFSSMNASEIKQLSKYTLTHNGDGWKIFLEKRQEQILESFAEYFSSN